MHTPLYSPACGGGIHANLEHAKKSIAFFVEIVYTIRYGQENKNFAEENRRMEKRISIPVVIGACLLAFLLGIEASKGFSSEETRPVPDAAEQPAEQLQIQEPAAPETYHKGYISAFSDGLFHPDEPFTLEDATRMQLCLTAGRDDNAVLAPYDFEAWSKERHTAITGGETARLLGRLLLPGAEAIPEEYKDAPLTRAMAVVLVNSLLGRNVQAIAAGELPLFPDVLPDKTYYWDVMEAAVSHTARYGGQEEWVSCEPAALSLQDGLYCYGGNLYVVEQGSFVTQPGPGITGDVSYTCNGASGVVAVASPLASLADGRLCRLVDGVPDHTPGLYEIGNGLYCVGDDGFCLVNEEWETLFFGNDGRYTSGNEQIDTFIDAVLSEYTDDSMEQEEKLWACYQYIFHHVNYRSNNRHVPRGQDCREWTEEYMLRLLEQGKGNCYCYASEMYYFCRRLGYWQVRAVSGGVSGANYDHGWAELAVDGVPYILDPERAFRQNLKPENFFLAAYDAAPDRYLLPDR